MRAASHVEVSSRVEEEITGLHWRTWNRRGIDNGHGPTRIDALELVVTLDAYIQGSGGVKREPDGIIEGSISTPESCGDDPLRIDPPNALAIVICDKQIAVSVKCKSGWAFQGGGNGGTTIARLAALSRPSNES
jgi:hypothetical protein